MTRHGPVLQLAHLDVLIDDLILTSVLPAREAASLSPEEIEVLRANVRSEIFYSDRIRELLVERAKKTLSDLREPD